MTDNPPPPCEISADPERLQRAWIVARLSTTYWAKERPPEVTLRAIEASYCYGAYDKRTGEQVGFARVVTDGATFAWVCDVVVDPAVRGRGIGRQLVAAIVDDQRLQGVTLHLATLDAHGLYEQFGFARNETMRRAATHRREPER